MRLHREGTAALVACLGLLLIQSANAQREREYQIAGEAAEKATAALASYNSFEPIGDDSYSTGDCSTGSCGFSSCGSGGLGLGRGFLDRPGQLFFGAEYIYARASFSEALAYVLVDSNDPSGGEQWIEHDFGYESSYRFYGGYQFCDCNAAITFNYGRYRSSADFNVTESATVEIFAPYETGTVGPNNNTLSGGASVEIDSYDLGVSRTIPLGSPLCCPSGGCGDTCCGDDCAGGCCDCGDGCGCWCPAWDITWSAGARFADVGWSRNNLATGLGGAPTIDRSDTNLSFSGAGARVGLLGRRYIGRRGFASLYAKGDLSLLVGNMHIRTNTQVLGGAPGPVLRSHENSARRMIPVTEIEAGLSAHVRNNITLSSGYFLAAWHDLGMRDTYDFNAFQLSHYDDANILGFDGFFARAEVAY